MTPRIGYCLLDRNGEVLAARCEDSRFYAASTIKLAVMAAAARAVDAGSLGWDLPLPVRSTFASACPGAPPFSVPPGDRDDRMPPDGVQMSLRDLLGAMVSRSSNEATNIVAETLGLGAVSEVLAEHAPSCRMDHLMGDFAARSAGLRNEVTPAGLARLLWAIRTGRTGSPASMEVMAGALEAQEFPVIADALPRGSLWGSKSGWVEGIDHDAAYFGPAQEGVRGVLAICTGGFPGRAGRTEIRRLARALVVTENLM